MAEGRQVAAGADAPLLRHQGDTPGVEHCHERLDQLGPHSARGPEEHVGPEQHDRANDGGRQWTADSGRMTADEIGLQLIELVGWNADVGELAEAGIDPVDRLTRLDGAIDQPATLEQRAPGLRVEGDANRGVAGDPDHILDQERLAVQNTG